MAGAIGSDVDVAEITGVTDRVVRATVRVSGGIEVTACRGEVSGAAVTLLVQMDPVESRSDP